MTSDYDISFQAKIEEEKNPFDVCAYMKPLKINFPQNVSANEHSLFKKKTLFVLRFPYQQKLISFSILKFILSALISFMTPCIKQKLYDI